jgi:hypothetical protein
VGPASLPCARYRARIRSVELPPLSLGRPPVERLVHKRTGTALTDTHLPFLARSQSSYTGRTDFRNPNSFVVGTTNNIPTDLYVLLTEVQLSRPHPLTPLYSCASSHSSPTGAILGESFAYGWWIVTFQLFATLYAAFVVVKAPAKRGGAAALLAVLTTSTFLMTQARVSAPPPENPRHREILALSC